MFFKCVVVIITISKSVIIPIQMDVYAFLYVSKEDYSYFKIAF